MRFIIGTIIVILAILGGYLPHGSFSILFQPLELLYYFGAAFGAFIIATPMHGVKHSFILALELFYKKIITISNII